MYGHRPQMVSCLASLQVSRVRLLGYCCTRYHMNNSVCPPQNRLLPAERVCQMLSNGYLAIHVFRYNQNTKTVFILAGVAESLEILIFPDGQ